VRACLDRDDVTPLSRSAHPLLSFPTVPLSGAVLQLTVAAKQGERPPPLYPVSTPADSSLRLPCSRPCLVAADRLCLLCLCSRSRTFLVHSLRLSPPPTHSTRR
jgi:hypothetical protein